MAKKNISDAITKTVKSVGEKIETVNEPKFVDKLIPISAIKSNEKNFFIVEEDDKFKSLLESISKYGVLQPVLVVEEGEDTYKMLSGHRRLKACQLLDKSKIPARVVNQDLGEKERMFYLLDTNMTVRDLSVADIINAIKEYEALYEMLSEIEKIPGRKTAWIGEHIGMSDRQVSKYMSLEKLDDRIKALFDEHVIGIKQASSLAVLTPEGQEEAYIRLKAIVEKEEEEKPGEEVKIVDRVIQEIKDEVTGKKEEVTETVEPEQKAEGETATVEEKPVTDFTDLGNGEKVEGKEPDFSELNNGEENLPFTGNETAPEKEEKPEIKVASLKMIKKNVFELINLCDCEIFENDKVTVGILEMCKNKLEDTIAKLGDKSNSEETE